MKNVLAGLWLILMSFSLTAAPRSSEWKKVDEAVSKGLPKTAITNLESIIQGALRDKAYAEATRAIGKKIALEGTIQGNKPEEKIIQLEAEIAKAPKEMVPVLDTLLAHWYWHYFQQNKWRFMQRTATGAQPGKDFTTWDLPRLFAEIDRQFQKALAAEKFLKNAPVSAWDDLLQKGTLPDSLRPTLYDFIAHEALEFYTSGEQAASKEEEAFELSAEDPILDSAEKFIAWQPRSAGETNSSSLRAIRLYQELLRFHQGDPPPQLAFADVDLERLTWGWNAAYGDSKSRRYKAALEEFVSGRNPAAMALLDADAARDREYVSDTIEEDDILSDMNRDEDNEDIVSDTKRDEAIVSDTKAVPDDIVSDTKADDADYNPATHSLGKLCPRQHDYRGSGQSVLRLSNRHCRACDREKFHERKQAKRQTQRA